MDFGDFKQHKTSSDKNKRRWYDNSFVKVFIVSLEKVPPYKRDNVAARIVEVVEGLLKNEVHRKIGSNKHMVLGMYKEFEKRRWYDRNPTVLKAVKSMLNLVGQGGDLQKRAADGIIEALGEYYIKEEPKVEVRPPEEIIVEQKAPEPEIEVEEEPEETKKPTKESKVMVSGEKLFIKRDKNLKPKPKNKPKM